MKITDKLESLPFDELYRTYEQTQIVDVKNWCHLYNLYDKITLYMPQVMRFITRNFLHQPHVKDNLKIINKIYDFTNQWHRGLYLFLQHDNRSDWMKSQTQAQKRQYSALVPLHLAAFKQKFDLNYTWWNTENLDKLVNPKLREAMQPYKYTFTCQELLDIRQKGLIYSSGRYMGKSRDPKSSHRLYNVTNSDFKLLPQLQQVMLTQIWCAHPSIRTTTMILDPKDWDLIPQPLLTQEVFVTEQKLNLPW